MEITVCVTALWPVRGFCRGTVKCKLVFPFTRMDNFSRLFAVFQSSTHKSVNLKRPFHSFIVNICQCAGPVIAVTGESRGPAMASQLHRFGNAKDYRPFHSGCGSQQVHIFWAVIPSVLQPRATRVKPSREKEGGGLQGLGSSVPRRAHGETPRSSFPPSLSSRPLIIN